MKNRIAATIALTALLATAAATQGPAANNMTLQPGSKLWVEGTSTVRGFSCAAGTINAAVAATSTGAVAATLAGQKAISTVHIEVPAQSLDCENGTMNGHMLKAIKADQHKSIVFHMTAYDVTTQGSEATVKLTGRLRLGGQEKPINMTAVAKQGPGGTLQVTGSQEIKLTDYGLKPPTLMMGTMKVGDAVQVKYDLILKP
jgi:polyisoprenoid-binding protein YceI